jgi:lipopolysaccharide/colanic/teichoic acid biosynthesis glycosyltransferase
MKMRPSGKKQRKTRQKSLESKDLSFVTGLGATTRGHRMFRDLGTFLVPTVLAIVLQAVAYLALYTRTAPDWPAAVIAVGALSLVPIASATTLSAFRRHESPITTAIAIVFIFFSFAITFLSALRIGVSFAGFAAALSLTLPIMAIANIRFHQRLAARVGLAVFKDHDLPFGLMTEANVALVTHPDADVSSFDAVLIDPEHHHTQTWSKLLARCYVNGVDVMPWTQFIEIRHGRVHLPDFDISEIAYTPSQLLYARLKRTLDIAAVVFTSPITVPLAGITALYIYARDGSPALFVQHRRGFAGRPFRVYKFRTMYKGSGGGATGADDERIIPGCKIVRRLRLDELPQLFNILIGDMSLIGPRPEALDLVRWYRREIPQWDYRMLVLPGITGWAQVNSGYTSNPEEARVKLAYDLYYIKHLSFDLDLQILFRTVRTVLFGSGAR